MITTIEFENFKAFKKVTIPLEPLTVFVGPNSSGKTTILQGIGILSRVDPFAQNRSPDPEVSYRRGGKGPFLLRVTGSVENEERELRLENAEPRPKQIAPVRVNVVARPGFNGRTPYMFQKAVSLRLDAPQLAAPSYSQEKIPALSSRGVGLASVLVDLQLREPQSFVELTEAVRTVIPSVERLRFERAQVDDPTGTRTKVWGHELIVDMRGAPDLPARLVSEGTLLTLGMLTVLVSKPAPQLVLLDDIELGLHPRAQKEFVGLLRRIMAQNPELQILATTHSPYFLDHLRPEEVRLTTLDDDKGEAHCACLTDSPDFGKWKDEMTPGEMWSVLGEDWVLKARGQGVH